MSEMITISRSELKDIISNAVSEGVRLTKIHIYQDWCTEYDLRELLKDQVTGSPATYQQVNIFIKKYNPIVRRVLGKRLFKWKDINAILDRGSNELRKAG